MKITYTSYNGKAKRRGKAGTTSKTKIVLETVMVALKELRNPDCTAINIRLTKEVK